MKYVGWACLVIALARPQASFREQERTISGVDIMMTMDVSASMDIEDLGDRSRIDIAKEVMEGFIAGRGNDRIGLVVFGGEPFTLGPPTLDYDLILSALRNARAGSLRDGTAIGDGLALAISHLRNSKAKSRIIVLLTDGENNVGQVDPSTAGEIAAGYGIKVYTIAVGREGRVKLPIKQRGPFGDVIVSYQYFDNALNPQLLKDIASHTGGRFYRVTEANTLEQVFKEIDTLEKTEIVAKEKTRYEERFQKPLKFGAILLVLEKLIANSWWRILP